MKKSLLYTLAATLLFSATACDDNDGSIPGWPFLDPVVNVTCGDASYKADYDRASNTYSFTVGTEEAPVSSFAFATTKLDEALNTVPRYLALAEGVTIEDKKGTYAITDAAEATNIALPWESTWTITVDLKAMEISATAATSPDRLAYIAELGWSEVGEEYGELPEYIRVFKSPETLEGQKAIAYIAVCDLNDGGSWDVLGDIYHCDDEAVASEGVDEAKTPSTFYEESNAPIVTNAGLFFYAPKSDGSSFYISQNLAWRDGKELSSNITYYSEDWVTIWYPTLGAFYEKADGTFGTTWTYYVWPGTTYCYPAPFDNSLDKEPLDSPSADSEGAEVFEAKTAIGGVGVLIHQGQVVNTWKQELLDVLADSRHPRTAIGYTNDNHLVLFVCEGRNVTSGVPGYTTGEVANILNALHCVEALNLDGGGSSCMLINGHETIKPSDGAQRPVATGIKLF